MEANSSQVMVAAVQASSTFGDVDANRNKFTSLAEQAATAGAKIIVLPEAALTGYVSQDMRMNWHLPGRPLEPGFIGKHPGDCAQTVPGPLTDHFASLAKRLGVYLTLPFVEIDRSARIQRFFNTVCLMNPAGQIAAHYRKLNPYPPTEWSWATPGNRGLQTCATEWGRVGLIICFDVHFLLELYRSQNLWAMLFSSAWVDSSKRMIVHWFERELPQRVAACNYHLLTANWTIDQKQNWHGHGFSRILSPTGRPLATATPHYGDQIIYATLPPHPR